MMTYKNSTKELGYGCVVITALAILSPIVSGWVLSVLWGWFVVPLFHLPALSIPYAIGIAMVGYRMVGGKTSVEPTKTGSDIWIDLVKALFLIFGSAGVTLGMGWIVKMFIR